MLEQEKEWKAAEQAARLARLRAKIREGVWALRDNSALPAHWEALERGEVAGGGETCDKFVGTHKEYNQIDAATVEHST